MKKALGAYVDRADGEDKSTLGGPLPSPKRKQGRTKLQTIGHKPRRRRRRHEDVVSNSSIGPKLPIFNQSSRHPLPVCIASEIKVQRGRSDCLGLGRRRREATLGPPPLSLKRNGRKDTRVVGGNKMRMARKDTRVAREGKTRSPHHQPLATRHPNVSFTLCESIPGRMRDAPAYELEVQVDCLGCERAVKEGR
jgi:hypothetical protein